MKCHHLRKTITLINDDTFTFFLFSINIFLSVGIAQTCGYLAPTGAAPQPVCGGTSSMVSAYNGMSLSFNVVSGNTYNFSTCSGASWDTQLAIWSIGGSTQYAYNDDDCGLQSSITWTATFSGSIVLMIYEYSCNTDGSYSGATVTISCTSPTGPPAPGPANCSPPVSTSNGPSVVCGGVTSITGASNGDGYIISVVSGQNYSFSTCGGTSWDTQLELWDSALTGSYAYNDDACSLQSTINWTASFTRNVILTIYEYNCNTDQSYTGSSISVSCSGGAPPCVSNPSPSDDCISAPLISNFDGYCGSTSGYTVQSPGNLGSVFCGSIENNAFLSFYTSLSTITLDYWMVGGASCPSGAQFQVFEAPVPCDGGGSWTAFTPCVNPSGPTGTSGSMTVNGLTVGQLYYLMIDGFAGDQCDYVFSAASGFTLPVEYYHFDAVSVGESNLLNWGTSREMNASFFEVERSHDGVDFHSLGKIIAAGNSDIRQQYHYEDDLPFIGVNYYRLKQVDYDDQINYSDIIAVNHLTNADLNDQFVLKSNPTSDISQLNFKSLSNDLLQIEIFDMMGRTVLYSETVVDAGYQRFKIDLTKYDGGMYVVKALLQSSRVGSTKFLFKQ